MANIVLAGTPCNWGYIMLDLRIEKIGQLAVIKFEGIGGPAGTATIH